MTKPTIGIEIELPWRTMLDRVDPDAAGLLREAGNFRSMVGAERERVQMGFDAVDSVYRDLVADAFRSDLIRRGRDGYAEFAIRPVREYQELEPIVSGLYENGVLREGESYPLHVTLGAVRPVSKAGLVLMAVEVADGTTPERVIQKGTWEQKGQAGVLRRERHKLELDMTTGVELRSLMMIGEKELMRALRVAQLSGSILIGRLLEEPIASERWRALFRLLVDAAAEKGFDASTKWRNPSQDEHVWQQLSAALADTDWRGGVSSKVEEIIAA
jgi:hypothetical protein